MFKKRMFWLLVALPLVVVAALAALPAALSLSAARPNDLGPVEGRLPNCPDSPNCVCSCQEEGPHSIEPFAWSGTAAEAIASLVEIIESLPRATVVAREDDYLHVEFATAVYRFVDDVEFLVDEAAGKIHIRSASRAGHSDLGVNRARVEHLRELLR